MMFLVLVMVVVLLPTPGDFHGNIELYSSSLLRCVFLNVILCMSV